MPQRALYYTCRLGFLVSVVTSVSLIGCTPDRADSSQDTASQLPPGHIRGVVRDLMGVPVVGATVEADGQQVLTDRTGGFTLWDLAPSDHVDVKVRASGYATGLDWAPVTSGETSHLHITVMPVKTLTLTDAAAGGVVDGGDGFRIEFPPNALSYGVFGEDTVEGEVTVSYAVFNEVEHYAASPDLYTDVGDGEILALQSFGMVDVELSQDGVPLVLVEEVGLEFPMVPEAADLQGGSTPLYYYDEEAGLWVEDGEGEVVEGQVLRTTVSHFTYWNSDSALYDCSCYRGRLVGEDKNPVEKVQKIVLTLTGGNYGKVSTKSSTDPATLGEFCIKTMPGSTAMITVSGDVSLEEALAAPPAGGIVCPTTKTSSEDRIEDGIRNWSYNSCLIVDEDLADAGYDGSPGDDSSACVIIGDQEVEGGDVDEDGYASAALGGNDCDDDDADVNPGATEDWTDTVDEDCDGLCRDQDGDSYPDKVLSGTSDCDDEPNAATDDDCAPADPGEPAYYFPDCDGDGYGKAAGESGLGYLGCLNPEDSRELNKLEDSNEDLDYFCSAEEGQWVAQEGAAGDCYVLYGNRDEEGEYDDCRQGTACVPVLDCNDRTINAYPGAVPPAGSECADADIDCDCFPESADAPDHDRDGSTSCDDCNDYNNAINKSATEMCTLPGSARADEDCDGFVDDDDPEGASGQSTWYADADGDGEGTDDVPTRLACEQPDGYVETSTDCDDDGASAAMINSSASESCDGANIDEDCDELADDGDTAATGKTAFYYDSDDDGYGVSSRVMYRCDAESPYVASGGDCDDASDAIKPSADETCDGGDNDCDGRVDEDAYSDEITCVEDGDGDGVGCDPDAPTCATESTCVVGKAPDEGCEVGYVRVETSADCDDENAASYPGFAEVCGDGVDNDCDGSVDESADAVAGTWYPDGDDDGHGAGSSRTIACGSSTDGYSLLDDDCDDGDSDVHPGAAEIRADTKNTNCSTEDEWRVYGYWDLDEGGVAVTGETSGDGLGLSGTALLGDLDGDSTAGEVTAVMTAMYRDVGTGDSTLRSAGVVYVFTDPEVLINDEEDLSLSEADDGSVLQVYGEDAKDYLGEAVVDCDVDADGSPDLILGASNARGVDGAVYVVFGPLSAGSAALSLSAYTAAADWDVGVVSGTPGEEDAFGGEIVCATYASDDHRLVVGAWADEDAAGAVYLLSDLPESGEREEIEAAGARLLGESPDDYAGFALASADLDGDGTADLGVGAYGVDETDGGHDERGAVYIVGDIESITSGDVELSTEADTALRGEEEGDRVGYSLAVVPEDSSSAALGLLVGAYGDSKVVEDSAAAWLLRYDVTADCSDDGGLFLISGTCPYDVVSFLRAEDGGATANHAGASVSSAGDVDGDGYQDVLIGAPNYGDSGEGAAFLLYGPFTASSYTLSVGDDDLDKALLYGDLEGGRAGTSLSAGADVNSDGFDDLLVGMPTLYGAGPGTTYLVLGGEEDEVE